MYVLVLIMSTSDFLCGEAEHQATTPPGHEKHGRVWFRFWQGCSKLVLPGNLYYRISTMLLSQKIYQLLIFYTGYFSFYHLNSCISIRVYIWIFNKRHSYPKIGDTQFQVLPTCKESTIVKVYIQLEEASPK